MTNSLPFIDSSNLFWCIFMSDLKNLSVTLSTSSFSMISMLPLFEWITRSSSLSSLEEIKSLSVKKKKKERKGVLYNTYRELLSEKWIVIRYRFHASYIISPQLVAIFATSHLVGCIVNYYNSLANKVDKSAVATSYKVVWIDFTFQNMVGQKFSQYNIKYETQKPSNENPTLKYTDTRQTKRFIESWSSSTTLVPYNLKFSKVHWYFNKNIVSQLYYTYRNYVHLPEKTNKNKQKKENKKQEQNYSRL